MNTLEDLGRKWATLSDEMVARKNELKEVRADIEAHIQTNFPHFAALESMITAQQEALNAIEQQLRGAALEAAKQGTKKILGGGIVVASAKRVTHYDEKRALEWLLANNMQQFIRQSPDKAMLTDLAKTVTELLPEDVIRVETVEETRIVGEKLLAHFKSEA